MTNSEYNKIVKNVQTELQRLANKNGWMWFYNLHQKEVAKFAKKLLVIYKKADYKIVLIACWLHDIAHYYARNGKEILELKATHHLTGANIAADFLKNYKVSEAEIAKIIRCIQCHRNKKPYTPKTLEEKIVTVADTMSHFGSIFYLTYFKFHPEHSLEQMVSDDLEKLKRDYRDIKLLPAAPRLIKNEYLTLKKLFSNFNKD